MIKNYKLAEAQQKFQSFYKANLQQIYKQLEQKRHKYLQIFYQRLALSFVLVGGTLVLCLNNIISEKVYTSDLFIRIAVLSFIGIFAILYTPFRNYRENTKKQTMEKILSFWGNFTNFFEQDIIGNETIKKSELFTYYNKADIDDAFAGKYSKTQLKVSEHNLKIKGSKGDTNIFKGVLILLDFSKKFSGKTVVKNKNRKLMFFINNPIFLIIVPIFLIPWVSIGYHFAIEPDFYAQIGLLFIGLALLSTCLIWYLIYKLYKKFHPQKATQDVTLEKIHFAKKWNVLTDNQVEARYILTPVFMEKMEEIKHLFHGKSIDFSFFDNKMLIAIHTRKNLFETTSLFSQALSYHKVREVVSQLHSIFSVIDVLEKR